MARPLLQFIGGSSMRAFGTRVVAVLLLSSGCAASKPARPGWKPIAPVVTANGSPAIQPRKTETVVAPEPGAPKPAAPAKKSDNSQGKRVVAEGRALISGKTPFNGRRDCSGFVMTTYKRAGLPLDIPVKHQGHQSAAGMLHQWAKSDAKLTKTPQPGDLAFFRDTYGLIQGRLTHVALVETIDEDGTVTLLHHLSGKLQRSQMNVAKPHDPAHNSYFRKKLKTGEPHLAAELFVAYARFVPESDTVATTD